MVTREQVDEQVVFGNPKMDIEATVERMQKKDRLGPDGKPQWSVVVSSLLEPPQGFGQPEGVWLNNVSTDMAAKLVEGGRYRLKVKRGKIKQDQQSGVDPDGSKVEHWWWYCDDVGNRLDAVQEEQQQEGAAPQSRNDASWENMQRRAQQSAEPTGRQVLGAERGNAWNVAQEIIATHIQATGSYPFPIDWNGTDEPEPRPLTLEEVTNLHAEAVELILQHNTASEQKVRS